MMFTPQGALILFLGARTGRARALFGQDETLEFRERRLQQLLLLRVVLVVVTDGRRARCRTTRIREALASFEALEDVVLDLEPGTLVLRLVLCPDQLGRVRELLQFGGKRLVREWIELLDADDR